jgi:hypothetical protein
VPMVFCWSQTCLLRWHRRRFVDGVVMVAACSMTCCLW